MRKVERVVAIGLVLAGAVAGWWALWQGWPYNAGCVVMAFAFVYLGVWLMVKEVRRGR